MGNFKRTVCIFLKNIISILNNVLTTTAFETRTMICNHSHWVDAHISTLLLRSIQRAFLCRFTAHEKLLTYVKY